jgi:hypothetical protein
VLMGGPTGLRCGGRTGLLMGGLTGGPIGQWGPTGVLIGGPTGLPLGGPTGLLMGGPTGRLSGGLTGPLRGAHRGGDANTDSSVPVIADTLTAEQSTAADNAAAMITGLRRIPPPPATVPCHIGTAGQITLLGRHHGRLVRLPAGARGPRT